MTFTVSGRTITQAATDTGLAALRTLIDTGVVAATRTTAYAVGNVRKNDSAGTSWWYQCTTAGTTGANAPTWPTTVDATVTDNGAATWAANTSYALNTRCRPSSGGSTAMNYKVTTAGTSGSTVPTFPTANAGTVTDNLATAWSASATLAVGAYRRPVTGGSSALNYKVTAITTGVTNTTEPTWPTVAAGTVVDGGVTWTAETAAVWTAETATIWTCRKAPSYRTLAASTTLIETCIETFNLNITGTCSWDADDPTLGERLVTIDVPTSTRPVAVTSGGTWNLGTAKTKNGVTRYSSGIGLICLKNLGVINGFNATFTDSAPGCNGGTWNWRGGGIVSCTGLRCSSGTLNIENGWIDIQYNSSSTTIQSVININSGMSSISIQNLTIYCRQDRFGATIQLESAPALFKNVVLYHGCGIGTGGTTVGSPTATPIVVEDFNPVGGGLLSGYADTAVDFTHWRENFIKAINSVNGTASKCYGMYLTASNSVNFGLVEFWKRVGVNLTDTRGAAISGAYVFMRDTNNGDRMPDYRGYSWTADRTYNWTTDASGNAAHQLVLLGCNVKAANASDANQGPFTNIKISYRCPGGAAGADVFTMYAWHYNFVYKTLTNSFRGNGILTATNTMLDDTTITETNAATIAAYTDISDASMLRDLLKYQKCLPANIEIPSLSSEFCDIIGTTIALPNYSLVFDKNAAAVFALVGNVITIKVNANGLAESAKYDCITAGGTITVLNGTPINIRTTSSAGSTSKLVVTGLAGASIRVTTDTGAEYCNLQNQTSYTSFLPRASSGTWTLVAERYGFKRQVLTFTPAGGVNTLALAWEVDSRVTMDAATVAAYTLGTSSINDVYDLIAYWRTQGGIAYNPVSAVGASLVATSNVVWDSTAASNVAYDSGTNTLTIKMATLTEGATMTKVETALAMSTANGAELRAITVSSGGTTSKLVVSGLVDSSLLIVDNLGATFANLQAQLGTYTAFLPRAATGTWSYIAERYGFVRKTGTFQPDGGTSGISLLWAADAVVQALLATTSARTDLVSSSQMYDYSAYTRTLAGGIAYNLCSKDGNALNFGAVNLKFSATAPAMWSYDSVLNKLTVHSTTISADDLFSLVKTTGAIEIDGTVINCAYADGTSTKTHLVINGYVLGSRIAVVNNTTKATIYNAIPTGTTLDLIVPHTGTDIPITVLVTYKAGATAQLPFTTTSTITNTGAKVAVSQTSDAVYAKRGLDGAVFTGIIFNTVSIDIDLNDADNVVLWSEIYAAYVNAIFTEAGITTFIGMVTALDEMNFVFNKEIVFNNPKATLVRIGGDGYARRSDDGSLFGSGNMQIDNYGKAFTASDVAANVDEMHAFMGLNAGTPLTITQSKMTAGTISCDLGGDGTTTSTVTRTA